MPVRYDPLPRSSSDSDDRDEFKHKRPRSRSCSYVFAVLRKTRRFCRPPYLLLATLMLLFLQVNFNTSYLHPPPFHASPDETVYIAANIVNAELLQGAWGQSLLELVDLIGKDRVYVSIYGGPADALKDLEAKLPCEKSIVSEDADPIDLSSLPHMKLHSGHSRIKRIVFLAEARNRALKPLDSLDKKYDRVLFVNDVLFEAKDAVRLLWGTNVDEMTGRAEYKAACGTDFISSWKYYDTFATRDNEGYRMGVPIFPWFSSQGQAESRRDVLDQRSAVRVKSCWGGIVAFDGRYFQHDAKLARDVPPTETGEEKGKELVPPLQLPVRFRAVAEPFWEASECCLVHADLMAAPSLTTPSWGSGIYMNPYVRVSYDATTHSRLWIARRFERLATLPQWIINYLARLPTLNPRRTEIAGQVYDDRVWAPRNESQATRRDEFPGPALEVVASWPRAVVGGGRHGRLEKRGASANDFWHTAGHFVDYARTAERGGFCGTRVLLALREGSWEHGNWEVLDQEMPPLESDF
jgi:hypothetical protein